ncbi:hypothetical protein [Mesorhizobium sp. KR9-304]|uniref:hypothetical protein n=1 Tax=Mesorhizobium sp. KR9-304 TaxID=3156614 RepID=UPI0032B55306
MEIYTLIIVAVAAWGGYHLGLWEDKDAGMMGSITAALIFAIPMGLWFAFNLLAYAFNWGGRSGFKPEDVWEVVATLLIGVAVWLCAVVVGYVKRTGTQR